MIITKNHLFLIIFVVCLISSSILSFSPIGEICKPGKGCEIIHHSPYSTIIFEIKNSHFGVAIFTFLIILTAMQIKKPSKEKQKIINLGIIIGSVIALYFIYIQAFILKAFCKYCMVVDISLLIALIILIIPIKKIKIK